jgi:hypothetical protein
METKMSYKLTLSSLSLMAYVFAASMTATASDVPIQYCKDDVERLCKDVEAGHKKRLKCLLAHMEDVSLECAEAIQTNMMYNAFGGAGM